MPIVVVYTNASKKLATDAFAEELTKVAAKELGKKVEQIIVRLVPDQKLYFGGKFVPFAHLELTSFNGLSDERNKEMAPHLTNVVAHHLKIPSEKILLQFHRSDSADIGINGNTFPKGFIL